jgi:hypothetical protein
MCLAEMFLKVGTAVWTRNGCILAFLYMMMKFSLRANKAASFLAIKTQIICRWIVVHHAIVGFIGVLLFEKTRIGRGGTQRTFDRCCSIVAAAIQLEMIADADQAIPLDAMTPWTSGLFLATKAALLVEARDTDAIREAVHTL